MLKPTYEELIALDKKVDEAFLKYLADGNNDEAYTNYWSLEESYDKLYQQADAVTKDRLWHAG